jgi:hypothetical protein
MKELQNSCPPQWSHRGWTVTLDPTSNSSAPRYLLTQPDGEGDGWCDSLSDAQVVIQEALS